MPPTCEEVMREIVELVLCRNFKVTTHLAQLPLGNVCVLVTQLCPALCDPTDCGLPGSSVHGILQARILEEVAISFSRGSSQSRDRSQVSHIAGRRFNL